MRLVAIKWMLALVVAAGMVATTTAQDYVQDLGEEKVALDQVPTAVKAKADEASKGAKFSRAFLDKSKMYRLVGKSTEGKLVVVQTMEDGQLVAFTTRSPSTAKSVPKVVMKAVDAERKKNAQLQGFRPASVEEADVFTAARGKLEHLFQFRGVNGEGLPAQVDVTPEGKVQLAKIVLVHPDAASGAGDASADGKGAKLPPELAEAVQMAVPGMQITGSSVEKSAGGITSYLVNGRDGQGHKVAADVSPNGVVVSVKYDLGSQEVPAQATALVLGKAQEDAMLAGFRPEKTQRIELRQLPGGGAVAFAFLGKNAKGQAYEVRVFAETGDVSISPIAAKDISGDASADDGADGKGKTGKKATRKKTR